MPDGAETSPDRRYFEHLREWIATTAGSLDGGLAELALVAFAEGLPADREEDGRAAFDRAVETVEEPGPRQRLEALRERRRAEIR